MCMKRLQVREPRRGLRGCRLGCYPVVRPSRSGSTTSEHWSFFPIGKEAAFWVLSSRSGSARDEGQDRTDSSQDIWRPGGSRSSGSSSLRPEPGDHCGSRGSRGSISGRCGARQVHGPAWLGPHSPRAVGPGGLGRATRLEAMNRELEVRYEARRVGTLRTDDRGRCRFRYVDTWLAARDAFPVSVTLPLGVEEEASGRAHAFFANLLPEGAVRQAVSRRLGISESNDVELLRAIGGIGSIKRTFDRRSDSCPYRSTNRKVAPRSRRSST